MREEDERMTIDQEQVEDKSFEGRDELDDTLLKYITMKKQKINN